MPNYKKVVVTTNSYSVNDMVDGTVPICDTKVLEGGNWSFLNEELPSTVVYENITKNNNPIEVSFGSGNIEGQTLKNILGDSVATGGAWESDCFRSIKLERGGIRIEKYAHGTNPSTSAVTGGSAGDNYQLIKNSLKPNTIYTVSISTKSNLTEYVMGCQLVTRGDSNGTSAGNIMRMNKKICKNGVNHFKMQTLNFSPEQLGADGYTFYIYISGGGNIEGDEISLKEIGDYIEAYNVSFIEEEMSDDDLSPILQAGLNSTQAIININDQEYPIYNPIIEGKTKVLKNGVEVTPQVGATLESLNSTDSSLPVLGCTPSKCDLLDLKNGIITLNTKETVLDGSEDWRFISNNDGVVDCYTTPLKLPAPSSALNAAISNRFDFMSVDDVFQLPREERVGKGFLNGGNPQLRMYFKSTWLTSSDIQGVKAWLKNNPVTVRYNVYGSNIENISINNRQLATYIHNIRTLELNKVRTYKDELIFNEDGSGTLINRTETIILKGKEPYTIYSFSNTRENVIAQLEKKNPKINTSYAICDKLSSETNLWDMRDKGVLGVTNYTDGNWNNNGIFVSISWKDMGVDATHTEKQQALKLKQWMEKNNLTIIIPTPPTTIHIPKHLMPHIEIVKNY